MTFFKKCGIKSFLIFLLYGFLLFGEFPGWSTGDLLIPVLLAEQPDDPTGPGVVQYVKTDAADDNDIQNDTSSEDDEDIISTALEKNLGQESVSLDFNNVEMTVFTRFVSEATGKNFVMSEKLRGKVTAYSPRKLSPDQVYDFFLSTLSTRGFTVEPSIDGKFLEIIPISDLETKPLLHFYKVKNGDAEEIIKPLSAIIAKARVVKRRNMKQEGLFEDKVSIVADKSTNSLIITSTQQDFETLINIIQDLDIAEKQVFVEVVIMEVDSDKIKEIGLELRGTNAFSAKNKLTVLGGTNFGNISNATTITGLNGLTGLAAGVVDGTFDFGGNTFLNVGVLLRMLMSESDTNVLSTPQILATNKKAAKIHVGRNVPFLKGTTTTATGFVQENIERQDVGITLNLTPKILEGKKVNLKIQQKIDSVIGATDIGAADRGPSTSKRELETSIIAENMQTVVLGGLITDSITNSQSKVPFLGDIPYMGWLFRFNSKRKLKTNLLVFMTPLVIETKEDFDKILSLREGEMLSFVDKYKSEQGSRLMDYIRQEAVTPPGKVTN